MIFQKTKIRKSLREKVSHKNPIKQQQDRRGFIQPELDTTLILEQLQKFYSQ